MPNLVAEKYTFSVSKSIQNNCLRIFSAELAPNIPKFYPSAGLWEPKSSRHIERSGFTVWGSQAAVSVVSETGSLSQRGGGGP